MYEYFTKLIKIHKNKTNNLYDSKPSIKDFFELNVLSIYTLLEEAKEVWQIGTAKVLTTALYNETTNPEKFVEETMNIKKEKNSKQSHAFKGYVYTYNVEILNSFNPELQLKNTESGIENKLKIVLAENFL